MQPYSVKQSIIEGELEVKEFFGYAQNNAAQFEAYEMERDILEGEKGVMTLDAQANFPKRCYSYLLQECMDSFGIRKRFGNAAILLKNFLAHLCDFKKSF